MEDELPSRGWPPFIEQWVLPYVDEDSLWPVLFALLGHVVVVLSPLMLVVWRTGSSGAASGLLGMGAVSLWICWLDVRRVWRPGPVSAVVVVTWLSGVGFAWLFDRTGAL